MRDGNGDRGERVFLKRAKQPVTKVLIYRLGSLGDTVVALPALHLVASAFPNAERRMLTSFPPNAKAAPSSAVLENTGLVSSYYGYTYGTRSLRELLNIWWLLLRWRPQVLIYMPGKRSVAAAKRDAWFFRLCAIRTLVGVPTTLDMELPRSGKRDVSVDPEKGDIVLEHESERLVRNLSALGTIDLADPESWNLHLTTAEQARAADALRPLSGGNFLALSLGTKMQANDWGRDHWCALVGRIALLYPEHSLVLCGAAVETEDSEYVADAWRNSSRRPALNLCGLLKPRESAAVFEMADVYLGHDSGPIHLAASVQTPCVGVYSARHLPGQWFPYGARHRVVYHIVACAGCDLEVCIVQKKVCILSITGEEVLAKLREVLTPTSHSSPITILASHPGGA